LNRKLTRAERERLGEELYALRSVALTAARRVLGDGARAEDACSEGYLRAIKRIDELPSLHELKTWFLRVVVNTARSMGRSEAARSRREDEVMRENGSIDAMGTPDEEAARRELGAAAFEELQALGERPRLAMSLHYEAGLSHSEVSEVLGVPSGTVASDISRGLDRVRTRLESRGFSAAPGAVAAALAGAAAREVPAALGAAVKLTIAGGLGIKSAGIGAVAGGTALTWKLLAGVAAVTLGGLGVWGGAKALRPETRAGPPAAERPVARKPTVKEDGLLEKRVTLEMRGDAAMVLAALHKQTGLRWAIPTRKLIGSGLEELSLKDVPARKALDAVAAKWGMTWKRDASGTVFFNRESPMLAAKVKALKAEGKAALDRAEAAYQLGKLGDLRALPDLAAALGEESLLVRAWAAEMLHRHLVSERQMDARPRGRYAGRYLALERHWLSAEQRGALVSALLKEKVLGDRTITHGTKRRPGQETRILLLACLDDDPRASKKLLELVDSEDEVIARGAIGAIGLSGKEVYLGKLLKLAEDAGRRKARLIASALRGFRSDKARKMWLKISLSKVSAIGYVRNQLGTEDTWAVEPLLEIIEDKATKPGHRNEAVNAMTEVADPKAENAGKVSKCLARLYADRPKSWRTTDVLRALAKYGRPEGRDALLDAMEKAPNGNTLIGVLRAASTWPGEDQKLRKKVREIAESKKPEWGVVRRHARRTLAALGGKDSIAVLKTTAMAKHELRSGIRRPAPPRNYVYMSLHPGYEAVKALRKMDSAEAREALAEISARTEDPLLKQQLGWDSFGALPQERAAAALLAAAEEAEKTDPRKQQLSLSSLARRMQPAFEKGGNEMAAALRKLAKSSFVDARWVAASGMVSYFGPTMKDDLLKLSGDPDDRVARASWSGLLKNHLRDEQGRRLLIAILKGDDTKRKETLLKALTWGPNCPLDVDRDRKKIAELVAAGGKVAEFARRLKRSAGPLAVAEIAAGLKAEDRAERWRARCDLLGYGFDPRVPVALEKHRKDYPSDFKRGKPGPRPKPKPGEVF